MFWLYEDDVVLSRRVLNIKAQCVHCSSCAVKACLTGLRPVHGTDGVFNVRRDVSIVSPKRIIYST